MAVPVPAALNNTVLALMDFLHVPNVPLKCASIRLTLLRFFAFYLSRSDFRRALNGNTPP